MPTDTFKKAGASWRSREKSGKVTFIVHSAPSEIRCDVTALSLIPPGLSVPRLSASLFRAIPELDRKRSRSEGRFSDPER